MLKAPIPTDERRRLAAVRALRLLDTAAEERFDRITRLATHVFGVPIAYVALIDADRQWFKSACGLDVDQTPRDISFCGHAILHDDTLVIPDTLRDERFADNPMVRGGPSLRFYAGQPLSSPTGEKVGTFCIADRQPRAFSEDQRRVLRELAAIVERELTMADAIRLQQELLMAQERLDRELQEAARYVRSLLPDPTDKPIRADYSFHPCSQLGGDALGYHWIDADHFAIYLLDVCGHGVGSALLSISAINALRSSALPRTDFRQPAEVLAALNQAFPMDDQGNKYFTCWYGVFCRPTGTLRYATAGHPAAVLLRRDPTAQSRALSLGYGSFFIGLMPNAVFDQLEVRIANGDRLFVFSDGAYEIRRSDDSYMTREELAEFLLHAIGPYPGRDTAVAHRQRPVELVYQFSLEAHEGKPLDDDFSLLELVFP